MVLYIQKGEKANGKVFSFHHFVLMMSAAWQLVSTTTYVWMKCSTILLGLLLLSFMVTVLGFLVLKLILAHPTSEKVGDSCSTTVKKYSRTPHQFSRTFPSNASLPSHYFQTIKTPDMTYCSRLTMRENSRVLFSAGRVGKKKCRFLTFYFFLVLFTGPAEMRRE